MSDEVLIRAEGVFKKFSSRLKTSMKYGVIDITRDFFGLPSQSEILRPNEFWSVQNISFEIRRGECLGLIGPNGAGKSTLLKMLNGIIMPDKGHIEIHGRIGALIEVGAGFHPLLTGRENIYINGAIMGLSKKEIDQKFDSIVEFAELGDFIDTPVSYYSSGMYVRLGFAIAAQMEPDVFLIDEILAVGDVGFRAKCFNAVGKISKRTAVILVSHSMPQIARMCSDICLMKNGRAAYQGNDVPKGIEQYYLSFEGEKGIITGSGRATIHHIELQSNGQKGVNQIHCFDDLTIQLNVSIDSEIEKFICNISFLSQELQIVAQCNSLFNQISMQNDGELLEIKVGFPCLNFNPGIYLLSLAILDESLSEVLIQHYATMHLTVKGDFIGRAPIQLIGQWSYNPVA
jgi:lipopolysaccharide transport system ATP-binding protein